MMYYIGGGCGGLYEIDLSELDLCSSNGGVDCQVPYRKTSILAAGEGENVFFFLAAYHTFTSEY